MTTNQQAIATSRDVFLKDGSFVDEGSVWSVMRTIVRYTIQNEKVLPEMVRLAKLSKDERIAISNELQHVSLEANGCIGTYSGNGLTFCYAVNQLIINSWDGEKFTNPISETDSKENAIALRQSVEGFLTGEYM